ncbi:MAG: TPM domain-containing protein, partial [Mobilicoccus sp.]|nr:TPM domain-containing protein [Mobilicoccus sp.]
MTRALAAVALGGALVLGGPLAYADAPQNLSDAITDNSGVLSGTGAARTAISDLSAETGLNLRVVFVDSFDGMNRQDWAERTFTQSGFGGRDILLAVATQDRVYSSWLTDGSGFTPSTWADVESTHIEPALRSAASGGDWGQVIVDTAEGIQQAAGGGTSGSASPSSPTGGQSGGDALLWVVGGTALAGTSAFMLLRGRDKKNEQAAGRSGSRSAGGPPGGGDPQDRVDPAELQRRAAAALVTLDDEIRSSGEELAFAEAQFGTQATVKFRQALERAKQGSVEAFRLQQQIDDGDIPEQDQPAAWSRIIALATDADKVLEEHTEEFTRMRDLQSRAPKVLSELERRTGEVQARIPSAKQQLASLEATYPAAALRTVKENVGQAKRLVASASGLIQSGREHLEDGDRPAAVVSARGAEDALGQASSLLDAVDRAHVDLPQAAEELDRRLASISSDIADAERLGADDQLTREALVAAQAAIARGREARTGGDPLGALADLDSAEHDLDSALERYREAEAHERKQRASVDERFQRARARLVSIDDTIRTHRGGVGREARTRISEALRLYEQAREESRTDLTSALSTLARAERLGEDALRIYEDDQSGWGGMGGMGGGMSRHRGGHRGGVDIGSMILGGILFGGGGGGGGSSWGGGGGGGGSWG